MPEHVGEEMPQWVLSAINRVSYYTEVPSYYDLRIQRHNHVVNKIGEYTKKGELTIARMVY